MKTPAEDTEDASSAARLQAAGVPAEDISQAAADLVRTQRADGGWGRLSDGERCLRNRVGVEPRFRWARMAVTEPVYRRAWPTCCGPNR